VKKKEMRKKGTLKADSLSTSVKPS